MSGLFITFEGIDGSGKSTQVRRLYQHFETLGRKITLTREPGGVPIAEALRAMLLDPANGAMARATELLLYVAARAQLVAEVIRPALDRGEIVICDRYYDSTIAYQGAGRGWERASLDALHRVATGNLLPDVTLLLDLDVSISLARRAPLGEPDRIEGESYRFYQRVRDGYLEIAKADPGRIVVLDATPDADAIARRIILQLQQRGVI